MGENMYDLGFGTEFICRRPTLRDIKSQTDKLGFSNEKFCSSKNYAKNIEIETFARRETFENHLSDKGLESRIHKEIS